MAGGVVFATGRRHPNRALAGRHGREGTSRLGHRAAARYVRKSRSRPEGIDVADTCCSQQQCRQGDAVPSSDAGGGDGGGHDEIKESDSGHVRGSVGA